MTTPSQLQDYQLLARLAIGGYCDIWLAKERGPLGFERQCALKTLRPDFLHDEDARRSFMAEARLVAKLDHPNIITMFKFGHDPRSDYLYYTMPFVQGRTLTKLIERGKATPYIGIPEVLWIGARIFDALAHVHELSDPHFGKLHIVHRDISPENLLISYKGHVRLIDFGIALSAMASRHTLGHKVKGKVQFLSPEQASGLELDHRSDIYSAGLTLYYMLTGQDALRATDIAQALAVARNPQILPPHNLVEMPHELSATIMAMLAVDRERRPGSARELRGALLGMLRKFYPTYTAAAFEANIARVLYHERLQDESFLANLSAGTQVIHEISIAEDNPSTTEIHLDELEQETQAPIITPQLSSSMTRDRGTEKTIPDMPAFNPEGLPNRSKELDEVLNALEDIYLPPDPRKK